MARGGRVLAVARGDSLVGGHFACGGKLNRGGHVHAVFFQDQAKRFKSRREADFRMPVTHGDGGQIALRAGKERAIHRFREPADGFLIG